MASINLNSDLKINFNRIENRYGPHTIVVCVGKIKVLEYYYDGSRPKDSYWKYRMNSLQPSLKTDLGKFKTEEDCKQFASVVIDVFIKQLTA